MAANMLTATESARVLARVRKMMNLANDAGATEGERDNALRAVHATLAKYNLDLATLPDALPGGASGEEAREARSKEFLGRTWTRHVANATATLFFCSYFYRRTREGAHTVEHSFVGRHSNVVTAQEMAEYLVLSVHAEATRYQRAHGGNYAQYRAFAQGATQRIVARCHELRCAASTGAPQGAEAGVGASTTSAQPEGTIDRSMGLVLASVYEKEKRANDSYIAQSLQLKVRERSTRERFSPDYDARRAGAEYGGRVSLNRQLK